ncbi:HAD family phosphatase [Petralouisia muris]|uniref:HAD family phosphatase n=1 Tax=Petralouisia muris TaxID=3032872 RepID=A0AC61RSG1_9FIRM|nr:Cof-type HAD-IIB family hydrolase [Petralouisia muris]TGY93567.1 HAD family phosphatase [Petralouisia muris]
MAGSERKAVKLLVSDLDGTLLNEKSKISRETAETVRKAQNAGIRFAAATGRSWSTACEIFQNAGIFVPCILLNGAEFRNQAGDVIFQEAITAAAAREVIEMIRKRSLDLEVITDKGEFSTNTQKCQKALEFSEFERRKDADIKVFKIFAFSKTPEEVKNCKKELMLWTKLSVTSSAEWNIEITSEKAQKGRMLEKVMEFYQISKEEVVVFGDGCNDESMFRMFPHSCAMKNAEPLICELAEKVIDSNRNHGVAKEINKIIQGGV